MGETESEGSLLRSSIVSDRSRVFRNIHAGALPYPVPTTHDPDNSPPRDYSARFEFGYLRPQTSWCLVTELEIAQPFCARSI